MQVIIITYFCHRHSIGISEVFGASEHKIQKNQLGFFLMQNFNLHYFLLNSQNPGCYVKYSSYMTFNFPVARELK